MFVTKPGGEQGFYDVANNRRFEKARSNGQSSDWVTLVELPWFRCLA